MLPLHAAAFEHQQQNIVVSGWPQGGKTSLLLAFIRHDAQYISDDWLYLNSEQQILGIPLPVTLRSWQIEQLPQIRANLSFRKQLRLQTIKHSRSLVDAVTQPIFPRSFTKLTEKVSSLLDARSHVTILPEELFGADLSITGSRIDKILLPISCDSPEIYVEVVSSEEGLAHLHQIQMYEWQPLLNAYHAYSIAVPEKHNTFLERLSEHLRELIYLRLRDVPVYRVYHPHPVDLDALYQTVLPYTK
jgi:hypothetical protein